LREEAVKGGTDMTLVELLDVYDYDRDNENQYIELCRPNMNWDDFDSVLSSSCLLIPFYSAKVKCIGTENKNAIRVDIDWNELDNRTHIFNWSKEEPHDH
jgi:hypothetical protein